MREIKFRGKRIDNGEWIYGYYGELTDGKTVKSYIMTNTFTFDPNKSIYFTDNEIGYETIGQYVGLKDKNGVEIYEGDIFKENKSIGEIKYEDASFFIDWKIIKDFWSASLKHHAINGEVIGNIYENAHLLN